MLNGKGLTLRVEGDCKVTEAKRVLRSKGKTTGLAQCVTHITRVRLLGGEALIGI